MEQNDAPLESQAQRLTHKQDQPKPESIPGHVIGHYRIIKSLGVGGMGEVYLAQDMSLGRDVAFKILPPHFMDDKNRLRRFEQEARTASALNHPNIVTIHEIGKSESGPYIVTEFIDGITLRGRLAFGPMNIDEALDVAIQLASALIAAHAKHIVHRDIKPENIIIGRAAHQRPKEIFIKVLDFGIAKLTEPEPVDPDLPTKPLVITNEGVAVGTVPYMSPEQAQGFEVDARTDIWSAGVVLYEMLAGRAPFQGVTKSQLMVSIVEKEPPSIATQVADIPEALEWIVKKALRKDREERYQSAKEFLSDLKDLRHRFDVGRQLDSSANHEDESSSHESIPQTAIVTRAANQAKTSTDATVLRNYRWLAGVLALGLLLLAATIGLKYIRTRLTAASTTAPFSTFKVTSLTTSGKATAAAISPDGNYVAHVKGEAEQQSLWLRHIATGSDKEIVPSNSSGIYFLSFSPDGNRIYFVRREGGEIVLDQVPVLGGPTKKLLVDIDTPVTFSPDSKRFAFIRGDPSRQNGYLLIADVDKPGEQKLITHPLAEFFWPKAAAPAWSPDGERIAFALKDGTHRNVSTVEVNTGTENRLISQNWAVIEDLAWSPDGNGLVIIASEQDRTNTQIWYATYPKGEVRRITNDLNSYENLSLTKDGKNIVAVQSEGTSDIWIAPAGEPERATQLTSDRFDGASGIAWTPDGRIVHGSTVSGAFDLWVMNADGSEDKQLTSAAGRNFRPGVCPNGRYIVFSSNRTGPSNIWRMDIDGNNLKQLSHGDGEFSARCTLDSQSVVFVSGAAGKTSILNVPIDGGDAKQITDYGFSGLSVSPKDGKIAMTFIDEQATPRRVRVAVISPEGGPPLKVFDVPNIFGMIGPVPYQQLVEWTPDGSAFTYIDTKSGVSNIWTQSVDGGPPKQLSNFKVDLIFFYAWSPDRKKLALARGARTSNVVLITDQPNLN